MLKDLVDIWDRTSFHPKPIVYYVGFGAVGLFMISYFFAPLFVVAQLVLLFLCIALFIDCLLLYIKKGVKATRILPDRFSNGDDNYIRIELENNYDFKLHAAIIDELPVQFQSRTWQINTVTDARSVAEIEYHLRPVERGEYHFGNVNIYAEGPLRMARRRFRFEEEQIIKVYPSYLQMRRYQLLAIGNYQDQSGVKRMRRLGHSLEFEQIKEYVNGDDYRTINWKATARRGDLMVNNFTDERSQQIYCIINKGRTMRMPFEGLTLLDYAINASLVISSVALQKQDKAGLITFTQELDAFLPADKKPTQINQILESLYKQQTNFLEPDFEQLFSAVRNRITQRSLLILFTNFESFESLERELPSLKKLAHYHLLVIVFFENTELKDLTESKVKRIEDIYVKTIAEKYRHEKQLIARELKKHGIISVLTTPKNLTVTALNKYLELKNRSSI